MFGGEEVTYYEIFSVLMGTGLVLLMMVLLFWAIEERDKACYTCRNASREKRGFCCGNCRDFSHWR